jgi:SAM-dependent methyltransferase
MGFSKEWEETYANREHFSTWPWSDLISFVHRFSKPSDGFNSILELGCGAGANIPFFIDLKCNYHGVDGSNSIIQYLHKKFPNHKNKILKCDFTKELPFKKQFDLIVDRSSLISNNIEGVSNGIKLLSSKLRNKGRFIAIDWFSEHHEGFNSGEIVDKQTRNNFPKDSDFSGIGKIHFCNKEYLAQIFSKENLKLIYIEHKIIESDTYQDHKIKAFWNFVCEKK